MKHSPDIHTHTHVYIPGINIRRSAVTALNLFFPQNEKEFNIFFLFFSKDQKNKKKNKRYAAYKNNTIRKSPANKYNEEQKKTKKKWTLYINHLDASY